MVLLLAMVWLAMVWLAARLPGVEQRFEAAMALETRAARAKAQTSLFPDPARHPREPQATVGQRGDSSPKLGRWGPAFTGVTGGSVTGQPLRVATLATTLPPAAGSPIARPLHFASQHLAPPPPQPIAPTASPALPAPPALPLPGFDLASLAYARLQTGDRRTADALFGAAIAAAGAPVPPHADAWRRERCRLNRHWSGDTYWLFRDAGTAGAVARPVLGGGQSGATLGYAIDPLAQRPVSIIGRIYAAHDQRGIIDGNTAQAAVGLRWQITPSVSIAAERLIAIGQTTSGDWELRIAGGGQRQRGIMTFDGYAEAGLRGNGDAYAGGQGRAMAQIGRARRMVFSAGPGIWSSIQVGQTVFGRTDIGAGITATIPVGITAETPVRVAISADWRWRVAGNAAPGSGPVVTVSAVF